ncbi:MAG: glycosyltransferase family protein [Candidatus Nanoarchaeia archaeon]|nr:glycosyltransferase family protein [Candidatus Nanoarchaeia archaeon]
MKILFVVTGFGYGDSVRTDAIIDEIKKLNPKSKFLILGYSKSYAYFSKKYHTLEVEGYNFPDKDMKFSASKFLLRNFYLPKKWFNNFKKHKTIIEDFNPDIVVSDFEPLGIIIARKLGIKCISIFGFDPLTYKDYPNKKGILSLQSTYISRVYHESDLVIIPSFKKQKAHSNIIYVNPIVRDYKPKNKTKIMKSLRLNEHPILVMLGGSNYGISLAKKIKEANQELNQELIIFGGNKQIPHLHFVTFKYDFLDYLNVCSGVITLGGNLTLSECLEFKKPALIFPIKHHVEQLMNAHTLRDTFYVETDLRKVKESMKNFVKNKNRIVAKLAKSKLKFNGAEQAAKIILKEAKL